MNNEKDITTYNQAIRELLISPVQGPSGTYHVKNGQIYMGYELIPAHGFYNSLHQWHILH